MEERIAYLLQRCKEDSLTRAEEEELAAFFLKEENRELFNREAGKLVEVTPLTDAVDRAVWEPLLVSILNVDKVAVDERRMKVDYRKWWQYAAAVVFIVALSGMLFRQWNSGLEKKPVAAVPNVVPGANKAILKLSNGSSIVLTDIQNGVVGQQGGAQVVKLDSGFVAYQPGGASSGDASEYNTLITPRGGSFKIMLPDGTLVWLNAASVIRYPAAFAGDTRVVELTGEAYFEVAAKANQPFHVKSKGQDVLVLGTHFNINAYDDEPVTTTTLVSGKVKVTGAGFANVLQPGEQLRQKGNNNLELIKNADTEEVIAWKKGYFSFNRADIKSVMRQLARWYDVDVIFENKDMQQAFVGELPRSVSLEKALDILKFSDVHYVITGRTIKITD